MGDPMAEKPDPDDKASDFAAMEGFWETVCDFIEGADCVIGKAETYLPKFRDEPTDEYKVRLAATKFSNIFRDIVEDLAAKPFAKEMTFAGEVPQELQALAEDIDGQGNHQHVFAAQSLFWGIAAGLDFILVDKHQVRPGATLAEERASGARPYWVRIAAERMIAAYTAMIDGSEQFVHVRFEECLVERDGFGEIERERVRVFDRVQAPDGTYAAPTYAVWEERENEATGKEEWVLIEEGALGLPFIPLVPVVIGKRMGSSWRIMPPMRDVVHLQLVHYRSESALEYTKTMTAFPMLTASGVSPMQETRIVYEKGVAITKEAGAARVPVGPKAVLYAPPNGDGPPGEWKYIEVAGTSLKFLSDEIARTEQQMRELGRQPLTAQTGNLTVVTTAFAASKGNSAVQAWALALKDAVELAWKYTTAWMGRSEEPEIVIHTDFAIEMESDKAPDMLLKMHETGVISRKALIAEAKRRDILSPEYDEEADQAEILAELPGEVTQAEVIAASTPPLPAQQ